MNKTEKIRDLDLFVNMVASYKTDPLNIDKTQQTYLTLYISGKQKKLPKTARLKPRLESLYSSRVSPACRRCIK